MAIETIGSMNQILNNHKTSDWVKSGKIDELPNLGGLNLGKELPGTKHNQSFSEMLTNSISDVNSLQVQADKAIQKLVSGESKNLHETMLSVEKADIAFKTMNQIRHKVIDAYKEVMRMQV